MIYSQLHLWMTFASLAFADDDRVVFQGEEVGRKSQRKKDIISFSFTLSLSGWRTTCLHLDSCIMIFMPLWPSSLSRLISSWGYLFSDYHSSISAPQKVHAFSQRHMRFLSWEETWRWRKGCSHSTKSYTWHDGQPHCLSWLVKNKMASLSLRIEMLVTRSCNSRRK